jgi:hypothetical protein
MMRAMTTEWVIAERLAGICRCMDQIDAQRAQLISQRPA